MVLPFEAGLATTVSRMIAMIVAELVRITVVEVGVAAIEVPGTVVVAAIVIAHVMEDMAEIAVRAAQNAA